ncbi:MAG: hypothetical protein PHF37_02235 [Phycisphaerae bacterium]|nr:hypothetical protein [Phycisphaerae bacterium]
MSKRLYIWTICAAIIYAGFSVYIYFPHFKSFSIFEFLFVPAACLAALGTFLVAKRWALSFPASLFAGAMYGFGPFMLSLGKFHPAASLLAAAIPWSFLPAVYGPSGRHRWLRVVLVLLPFILIIIFFRLNETLRLFAVPIQIQWTRYDLAGLIAPVVLAKINTVSFGFYHCPVAPLLIGFLMLIKASRPAVLLLLAVGTTLAVAPALFGVSPVMWAAIPSLCCAVLVGVGIEALVYSAKSDKTTVLSVIAAVAMLAVTVLFLAVRCQGIFAGLAEGYAREFVWSAKMYLIAVVMLAVIFATMLLDLRYRPFRWIIVIAGLAVDIYLGAILMAAKIF